MYDPPSATASGVTSGAIAREDERPARVSGISRAVTVSLEDESGPGVATDTELPAHFVRRLPGRANDPLMDAAEMMPDTERAPVVLLVTPAVRAKLEVVILKTPP